MTIRPASPDDVPAILPLVSRECAFHQQADPDKYPFLPHPEQRYRHWLAERACDPRSVLLVAEHKGDLVGFIVGDTEAEIPIYTVREFGFLHDLWVDEAHRRKGVARKLLLAAIARFREMGVDQVRLDVLVNNSSAQQLFRECGFRPTVVEMVLPLNRQGTDRP